MSLQKNITKIKTELLGEVYFEQKHQLSTLDEVVEFLDEFEIPNQYQNILIQLSSPVELIYLNNQECSPIADEEVISKNKDLMYAIANYHLQERKDFYCAIGEPNNREQTELGLFENSLIQTHFNLTQNDTIIIPEPTIIITSQNQIAFPCIYDPRTFTKENLQQELKK